MSFLKISLHPLVMLNMTDHLVRRHAAGQFLTTHPEAGVLLGTFSAETLTAITSFELMNSETLDLVFLYERFAQFQVIHPTLRIVGFYQFVPGDTTLAPNLVTADLFAQLLRVTPDLACLLFSTSIIRDIQEQSYRPEASPMTGFKSVNAVFQPVEVTIESSAVEKVSVDTILNMEKHQAQDGVNTNIKSLKLQNQSQGYAVKLLQEKVAVILSYIERVGRHPGLLTANPAHFQTLREINALTLKLRLILLNSDTALLAELDKREVDANMAALLSLVLTQVGQVDHLNSLTTKLFMKSKYAEKLQVKFQLENSTQPGPSFGSKSWFVERLSKSHWKS
ncbi:hypothetical protein BABINDRAFT_7141 [Babjeviella inositovora NRRL Y-12698]|uniref:MPN domain-containing protein n=1 Tax=Babjeviella inositovora NRRL Y-12698 TaxID=984486 RepID=A0A1E3QUG6_9ASCO|nr:uncharacterized protein BABINDRAFT_7141 [Babjeviella inositovora NRRL Y-12698]ODQ81335.1 hypothetical protein BABINDRAFT_7141 [Babjeviella inositovora NRRL Y-12698]